MNDGAANQTGRKLLSYCENVDYRYAYDPARNIIRLTPIAGIWEDNAVYTIEMLGQETGIIQQDSYLWDDR